jgi:glucokinase
MKDDVKTTEFSYLAADIGWTNVRFGVVNHSPASSARPQIIEQKIYPCASFDSIDVAMETYREQIGVPLPHIACVAVAGPVKNNIVRMTNRNWLISGTELTSRFGFEQVVILNDAAAIAYATRVIGDSELNNIKPGLGLDESPAAVITAGTGVGVAAIVPFGDNWYPLPSEAGHVTLAPQNRTEIALFNAIKADIEGAISAEMLLSGAGIRRLYCALAAINGSAPRDLAPEQITLQALDGADPICVETLEIYSDLLGAFAGDIALTFGARGGIYLAGSVLRQVEPFLLRNEQFRHSFEHKGAMGQYLAEIPVQMIKLDEPGLVGASAWFEHSVSARPLVNQ